MKLMRSSSAPGVFLVSSTLILLLQLVQYNNCCNAFQIGPLLSTCIDACQRGCDEIRRVQEIRRDDDDDDDDSDDGNCNGNNNSLQVKLKDGCDPKSALTIADTASQSAIVNSLRLTWGESLRIVAEEEEEDNDDDAAAEVRRAIQQQPLRTDLLQDDIGETNELNPKDVTIFVDPLDGTREFVEGRLENCQVLVGIAIEGEAVAGAVGIPFPTGLNNLTTTTTTGSSTIVYGLDGLGTGTIGSPLTRGPWPLEHNIDGVTKPHPHYATGDQPAEVIVSATENLKRSFGGTAINNYGGAGNRILGAALGEVACCLAHKVGGPWDLCAPEAIAKAMGADMTDLFGDKIDMYRIESPPQNNARGFVVSPTGSDHKAIIAAVERAPEVQEYKRSLL